MGLNVESVANIKHVKRLTSSKAIAMRPYYFLLVIPVIHQILFSYLPIFGVVIAFKNYRLGPGIWGSPWNNFAHFKKLFTDYFFGRAIRNTLTISSLTLILTFVMSVIFALLLNEIIHMKFKRVIQTISYLPHFFSWVVMGGFVYRIFSMNLEVGAINSLLVKLGIVDQPIMFMANKNLFVPIFLLVLLWKEIGWGSIIYLSAIAGIDVAQYESATIDGATRFQKIRYITLPSMVPTMTIILILSVGGIMNVSFEAVWNLQNPLVYERSDVLSTLIFRKGLLESHYDYSTAVGFFQNAIGFVLVLITNKIVKKLNDYSLF
ncbi:MAG: sugar ABC transporter permease [Ruminiclostridium sp.]|nr:sugar ABC transporter permease [Ruminiclostridium sp.]